MKFVLGQLGIDRSRSQCWLRHFSREFVHKSRSLRPRYNAGRATASTHQARSSSSSRPTHLASPSQCSIGVSLVMVAQVPSEPRHVTTIPNVVARRDNALFSRPHCAFLLTFQDSQGFFPGSAALLSLGKIPGNIPCICCLTRKERRNHDHISFDGLLRTPDHRP